MSTIVTEEKIFNSMKNTREQLASIRKAIPCTSYINSSFILAPGKSYITSACSYIHIHSNNIVNIKIKKDGQVISIDSILLTLYGVLDQVTITNIQDSNNDVYITYAC